MVKYSVMPHFCRCKYNTKISIDQIFRLNSAFFYTIFANFMFLSRKKMIKSRKSNVFCTTYKYNVYFCTKKQKVSNLLDLLK